MAAQAAKRINKVGFLVAMQEEAAPFIGALKLQKRAPHARAPIVVHEGSYKDATVLVYSPGVVDGKSLVGTDAAFLTAFLAAEDRLDLFVNAGTCGGFSKRGGKVGDVYCCDEFKHHDRRVPIPGYDAMCVGHRRATPAPGLVSRRSASRRASARRATRWTARRRTRRLLKRAARSARTWRPRPSPTPPNCRGRPSSRSRS